MQFWFILPSWKGSAHQNRTFKDIINDKNFVIPKEKYWLANGIFKPESLFYILSRKIIYS